MACKLSNEGKSWWDGWEVGFGCGLVVGTIYTFGLLYFFGLIDWHGSILIH